MEKAREVWDVLLERAQGDEDRFRRELEEFLAWADTSTRADAVAAGKAVRRRMDSRKGKSLLSRWWPQ